MNRNIKINNQEQTYLAVLKITSRFLDLAYTVTIFRKGIC